MTSFAELYRNRVGLSERYYALVRDAQKHREEEYAAAVKIERAWRRHRTRQEIARRHRMATVIQTAFRRYQARVYVECLRVEKARSERIAYFNFMATRIQKTWRGYNSRRKGNVEGAPLGPAPPSIFQPPALTSDRTVMAAVVGFVRQLERTKKEMPNLP